MEYDQKEEDNIFINNKNNSNILDNSVSNCYINSCPLDYYLNNNLSKNEENNYSNSNIDNEINNNIRRNNNQREKICNLNNPKLIEAYNEGYYGISNIPKQYYIYPKFSNVESPKDLKYKMTEQQQNFLDNKFYHINDSTLYNHNNYDNNYDLNNNNNLASNENYPYLKLINVSSKYFKNFHFGQNQKSNKNNNDIEKEKKNENNKSDIFNKEFNISLNVKDKDQKNLKIKGMGKIVDVSNDKINNKENKSKISENNKNDNEEINDSGNFYYINNNITQRNVPYKNNPDNISIDDDEEEDDSIKN